MCAGGCLHAILVADGAAVTVGHDAAAPASQVRSKAMKSIVRARIILPALLSALALSVALLPASTTSARSVRAASPVYLTSNTNFWTTMVRNFNPFAPSALDFTKGAIYEPLYIITTAGGGHSYPWLATGYKWTNGNKTLLVTIRHGVKWSDGQPFTAKDVAFTFNYGKT